MKVSEVIKQLQQLDPNEEIVIMYWTKELFDDNYDKDNAISTDVWNEAVDRAEGRNNLDYPSTEVYEIIESILIDLKLD